MPWSFTSDFKKLLCNEFRFGLAFSKQISSIMRRFALPYLLCLSLLVVTLWSYPSASAERKQMWQFQTKFFSNLMMAAAAASVFYNIQNGQVGGSCKGENNGNCLEAKMIMHCKKGLVVFAHIVKSTRDIGPQWIDWESLEYLCALAIEMIMQLHLCFLLSFWCNLIVWK